MKNVLNILVASDHKASRAELTHALNNHPSFHVIAVCADAFAAITMTENATPDIVIIDGSTDPLACIEATKKIMASSNANVIGMSRVADSDFAKHILAAGALGYLTNYTTEKELIYAVQEVAKDNLYSCISTVYQPLHTPERVSSLTQSMAGKRSNTGATISNILASQWHSILQYAN